MSNKGATGLSTILGIGALVFTVGFLFWLYQRSQSLEDEVQPVMEDTVGETETPATLADLRQDPEGVVGRRAELDSATVASRLGRGVFSIRLDTASAYPVLFSNELMQEDRQIYGGDILFLRGRFFTLSDSIRGAWLDAGVVDSASAGDVPTTPSFLLADSLDIY